MNSRLRSMLFVVGTVVLGGVGFTLLTPQPATRTMAELRDAGITDGQRLVLVCPERLTQQTRNRIKRNQPDALRPKQVYARVARVAVCFSGDGGNCIRPADGGVLVADGEVVVPSLRRDLSGVDLDAGGADDAGEDVEVDDSLQFRLDDCQHLSCAQYDVAVDAGTLPNPFANRFCGALNRLAAVPAPCAIPLCLGGDGGWDDNAVVDCRATGPYGEMDGGARWRGCNATPSAYVTGSACVPVECSVVAGDDLVEEWR